jgi:predicted 3-demethylubiquinone-9 3-methyltransferase (glyoxalase superfamily)
MSEASKLDGQKFTALNGGPLFRFTEAVSVKKLGYRGARTRRAIVTHSFFEVQLR